MNKQSGYCVCKKDNHIIARNINEALNDESEIQKRMYQLFDELV